jgi:hypothetical protein
MRRWPRSSSSSLMVKMVPCKRYNAVVAEQCRSWRSLKGLLIVWLPSTLGFSAGEVLQ